MKINESLAYDILEEQLPKDKYSQIVTIGRGGLSIAQKLAYYLNVPIRVVAERCELANIPASSLFVDDIACTGKTLEHVNGLVDTAALVTRDASSVIPTYTGVTVAGEAYIHFSWEGNDNE